MNAKYILVIRLEAENEEQAQRLAKELSTNIDMSNAHIQTPDSKTIYTNI